MHASAASRPALYATSILLRLDPLPRAHVGFDFVQAGGLAADEEVFISYGDGQSLTPDETLAYYGFIERDANSELCTIDRKQEDQSEEDEAERLAALVAEAEGTAVKLLKLHVDGGVASSDSDKLRQRRSQMVKEYSRARLARLEAAAASPPGGGGGGSSSRNRGRDDL